MNFIGKLIKRDVSFGLNVFLFGLMVLLGCQGGWLNQQRNELTELNDKLKEQLEVLEAEKQESVGLLPIVEESEQNAERARNYITSYLKVCRTAEDLPVNSTPMLLAFRHRSFSHGSSLQNEGLEPGEAESTWAADVLLPAGERRLKLQFRQVPLNGTERPITDFNYDCGIVSGSQRIVMVSDGEHLAVTIQSSDGEAVKSIEVPIAGLDVQFGSELRGSEACELVDLADFSQRSARFFSRGGSDLISQSVLSWSWPSTDGSRRVDFHVSLESEGPVKFSADSFWTPSNQLMDHAPGKMVYNSQGYFEYKVK